MAGRKPFTPTDEQRRTVRTMGGCGVPHDDVAAGVHGGRQRRSALPVPVPAPNGDYDQ